MSQCIARHSNHLAFVSSFRVDLYYLVDISDITLAEQDLERATKTPVSGPELHAHVRSIVVMLFRDCDFLNMLKSMKLARLAT